LSINWVVIGHLSSFACIIFQNEISLPKITEVNGVYKPLHEAPELPVQLELQQEASLGIQFYKKPEALIPNNVQVLKTGQGIRQSV
jgi:hypothetical protein